MKLVISGGRNQRLSPQNLAQLDSIADVCELVSGHAKGIDQNAENWAVQRGIPVKLFKPDWVCYGRAAGPIRNKEMAEYADILAIFPGGKGTSNMLETCKKSRVSYL